MISAFFWVLRMFLGYVVIVVLGLGLLDWITAWRERVALDKYLRGK